MNGYNAGSPAFSIRIKALPRYLFLGIYGISCVIPFLWIILSSFKDNGGIFGRPFSLPEVWRFSNYYDALTRGNVGSGFLNSTLITAAALFFTLLFSSMAAYILARIKPNLALYTYFTAGIMVPLHSIIIPSFIMIKNFGLINKHPGVVLTYIAGNMAMSVFLLAGFMRSIPKELEEAAMIDGCSMARTFFSIIIPITKPGLATAATLAFLACWNDYLFASVIIASPGLKTLTMRVYDLKAVYSTEYGLLCAGVALAIVPVIVMYVLFQEQVIKGMTAGAVKG